MNIFETLCSKDDKSACAFAEKIIKESLENNIWYEYFNDFASLLDHNKSLVRNRAINILAVNLRWDKQGLFDSIFPSFLSHITDEKPITARQCIKSLELVGLSKPKYIQTIISALNAADLSKYNDNMRPLLEKDIENTINILIKQLV